MLVMFFLGIENAGPVAALEIMKEFPGDGIESLIKFKTWWDDAHQQVSAQSLSDFKVFITLKATFGRCKGKKLLPASWHSVNFRLILFKR